MGYLYSLSGFQPNVRIKQRQPTKVAENWRGRFSWIGNRGVQSRPMSELNRVCQKCASSAKLGQIRRRSAAGGIVARH
jgi:hypothetical protein